MAICIDCAHRSQCTFPRTETTHYCDEYDDTPPQAPADLKEAEWDLQDMLSEWGFTKSETS